MIIGDEIDTFGTLCSNVLPGPFFAHGKSHGRKLVLFDVIYLFVAGIS
jgi:hypothetical protein